MNSAQIGAMQLEDSNSLSWLSSASPVWNGVLSWLLMMPLLYYATASQPSIFRLEANNGMMTTNGYLIQTQAGIRPHVVGYWLFMAVLVAAAHRKILRGAMRNRALFLSILFAFLSAAWSVSALLSVRMSVELTLTTVFAIFLTERFSPKELAELTVQLGAVAAVLSLFLVAVFPDYGIYHRGGGTEWQGIYSHKNALGASTLFLMTPIFFLRGRKIFRIGYVAVMLVLIVMCQSRGAWFETICLFAFVGWLWLFRRSSRQFAYLQIIVSVALVAGVAILGLLYLGPIMTAIGKDPTLTGRTDIYRAVLESIFKHPVLGYGYGAFWLPSNPEPFFIGLKIHWLTIGYAENGLLELWLELGTLGLVLVGALFFTAIRQVGRLIRSEFYNPCIGWFATVLFLELITNIEGGVILVPATINWLMTLIAFVCIGKESLGAEQSKLAPAPIFAN